MWHIVAIGAGVGLLLVALVTFCARVLAGRAPTIGERLAEVEADRLEDEEVSLGI